MDEHFIEGIILSIMALIYFSVVLAAIITVIRRFKKHRVIENQMLFYNYLQGPRYRPRYFPPAKKFEGVTISDQLSKIHDELQEVFAEYGLIDSQKDVQSQKETVEIVVDEIWDVIHACETLLDKFAKEGIDVYGRRAAVEKKNFDRGYYGGVSGLKPGFVVKDEWAPKLEQANLLIKKSLAMRGDLTKKADQVLEDVIELAHIFPCGWTDSIDARIYAAVEYALSPEITCVTDKKFFHSVSLIPEEQALHPSHRITRIEDDWDH